MSSFVRRIFLCFILVFILSHEILCIDAGLSPWSQSVVSSSRSTECASTEMWNPITADKLVKLVFVNPYLWVICGSFAASLQWKHTVLVRRQCASKDTVRICWMHSQMHVHKCMSTLRTDPGCQRTVKHFWQSGVYSKNLFMSYKHFRGTQKHLQTSVHLCLGHILSFNSFFFFTFIAEHYNSFRRQTNYRL